MQETRQELEPLILVEVAGTWYGLKSSLVQHIEMIEKITPVPNVPEFIEGLVLSRGQVIPALSLRRCFGFEKEPFDLRTRLVVVRSGERKVGLIVDSAREFIRVFEDNVIPVPPELAEITGRYVEEVVRLGERLVLVLNIQGVLETAGEEGTPIRNALEAVQAQVAQLASVGPAGERELTQREGPA